MTVDKYNIDWSHVEKALNEGTFSGYKIAVLETEKILRSALDDQRIPGRAIEHRLLILEPHLSKPGDLAHARLMAGKVVQEPGFDLSREDTKAIIASYYHAITDIATLQRNRLSLIQRFGFTLQRLLPGPQIRSVLLWIIVAAFGILFLSETSVGRAFAFRAADLMSFLAIFVFAPIGALYLLLKVGKTLWGDKKQNRDLPL